MNKPDDDYRDLSRQLDEAAELCRAEHAGWDTLLERLPARKSAGKGPEQRRRWSLPWKLAAMAAGLLLAATLALILLSGPGDEALAEDLPIEVQRRGIQVTIFNKSENTEPTLFMPLVAPIPGGTFRASKVPVSGLG